jgi:hypothetical protein
MMHVASLKTRSNAGLFLSIIFLLITGLLVSTLARFMPAPVVGLPASSIAAKAQEQPRGQSHSEQVEVEEVLLSPNGFEPSELNLPSRRFILAVVNRSQAEDLSLQIYREAGGKQHEMHLPGGQVDWADSIDLPPGRYLLTEANHPDWRCRIIISPH